VPAIVQAISAPRAPLAPANFDGRVKMPAPTIDPMTSATSAAKESF
jgi:hypothetical protein